MLPKLRNNRRTGVIKEFTPAFPPRTQLFEDEVLDEAQADDVLLGDQQEPRPNEAEEHDTAEGDGQAEEPVPAEVQVENADQAGAVDGAGALGQLPAVVQDENVDQAGAVDGDGALEQMPAVDQDENVDQAGVVDGDGAAPQVPVVVEVDNDDLAVEGPAASADYMPPVIVVPDEDTPVNGGETDGEFDRHPLDPDNVDAATHEANLNAAIHEFRACAERSRLGNILAYEAQDPFQRELDAIDAHFDQERQRAAIRLIDDARAAVEDRSRQQPATAEQAAPRVYPPQRRRPYIPAEEESDDDDDIQIIAVVPRQRRRLNPEVAIAAARKMGFELKDFEPIATAGRPAPKEGDCVVCFVEDSTCAIVGCGHLCLCGPCAIRIQLQRSCPVCRWMPEDENSPFAIIAIFVGKEKPEPEPCQCQSATKWLKSVDNYNYNWVNKQYFSHLQCI